MAAVKNSAPSERVNPPPTICHQYELGVNAKTSVASAAFGSELTSDFASRKNNGMVNTVTMNG